MIEHISINANPELNMILSLLAALLIVGTTVPALAEAPSVQDGLVPAARESVRISVRLGEKLDLCFTHRILAQDVEAVVAPYRPKTEIGGADWRCEYWGRWCASLTLADAYHSTPVTRELRGEAAKALMNILLVPNFDFGI